MATWRCPHCRTVQAESARCFLCNRSATSCGTCANFRESVVGGVGYCGLDRRREPLDGAEQRACWSSADDGPDDGLFGPATRVDDHAQLTPAPFVEARPTRA